MAIFGGNKSVTLCLAGRYEGELSVTAARAAYLAFYGCITEADLKDLVRGEEVIVNVASQRARAVDVYIVNADGAGCPEFTADEREKERYKTRTICYVGLTLKRGDEIKVNRSKIREMLKVYDWIMTNWLKKAEEQDSPSLNLEELDLDPDLEPGDDDIDQNEPPQPKKKGTSEADEFVDEELVVEAGTPAGGIPKGKTQPQNAGQASRTICMNSALARMQIEDEYFELAKQYVHMLNTKQWSEDEARLVVELELYRMATIGQTVKKMSQFSQDIFGKEICFENEVIADLISSIPGVTPAKANRIQQILEAASSATKTESGEPSHEDQPQSKSGGGTSKGGRKSGSGQNHGGNGGKKGYKDPSYRRPSGSNGQSTKAPNQSANQTPPPKQSTATSAQDAQPTTPENRAQIGLQVSKYIAVFKSQGFDTTKLEEAFPDNPEEDILTIADFNLLCDEYDLPPIDLEG